MQDWEVLYQHLEPEVSKTEITLVGADAMFPLGLDKGFPTEKSFIVLQGEVSKHQFQSCILTAACDLPNAIIVQAYIFMKDVNPEDIPEGVDIMYEDNWNFHTIRWHLDNAGAELKSAGAEEVAVKLSVGKQFVVQQLNMT